jgi:hypothetical protein
MFAAAEGSGAEWPKQQIVKTTLCESGGCAEFIRVAEVASEGHLKCLEMELGVANCMQEVLREKMDAFDLSSLLDNLWAMKDNVAPNCFKEIDLSGIPRECFPKLIA